MGRKFRMNTRKTGKRRRRPGLKVLDVEYYFIKYDNGDNDDFDKMTIGDMLKYDNLKKIDPIIGRFGWYYDRKTNVSWVESEYGSYMYPDPAEFKNKLKFIVMKENILPKKVMNAINTIRNYGIKIKKLEDMYFGSKHVRELKEIYYGTVKFMSDM